jgi:hypothetical protein
MLTCDIQCSLSDHEPQYGERCARCCINNRNCGPPTLAGSHQHQKETQPLHDKPEEPPPPDFFASKDNHGNVFTKSTESGNKQQTRPEHTEVDSSVILSKLHDRNLATHQWMESNPPFRSLQTRQGHDDGKMEFELTNADSASTIYAQPIDSPNAYPSLTAAETVSGTSVGWTEVEDDWNLVNHIQGSTWRKMLKEEQQQGIVFSHLGGSFTQEDFANEAPIAQEDFDFEVVE